MPPYKIRTLEIFARLESPLQYLLILSGFFLLTSCSQTPGEYADLPGIDFGTSTYYDSFLFSEAQNPPVQKRLLTSFNQWSMANGADAELIFTDESEFVVGAPGSGVDLYVNGQHSLNGKMGLNNLGKTTDTLHLELRFSSSADSRNFIGFLKMTSGTVERINNIETLGTNIKLFQWNARQQVVLNPMKKALYIALAGFMILLFIWFVFLRNQLFPKMGNGSLTIQTPYFKSFKTKGNRKIFFTSKPEKQSFLNKVFAGTNTFEKSNVWQEDIIFTPGRRNQIRVKLPPGSSIEPYTSKLTRGQSYVITKDGLQIKLSYL